MVTKHTKKELFTDLLVFASAAEAEDWVIDGLNHELELLAKRAGTKGGNVKREKEQTALAEVVCNTLLVADEPMRATAIAEAVGISVQKATASLRKLVASGDVLRIEDKKVTTFVLAEGDTPAVA